MKTVISELPEKLEEIKTSPGHGTGCQTVTISKELASLLYKLYTRMCWILDPGSPSESRQAWKELHSVMDTLESEME